MKDTPFENLEKEVKKIETIKTIKRHLIGINKALEKLEREE